MPFTDHHLPVSEPPYSDLLSVRGKTRLPKAKFSTCMLNFTTSPLLKNNPPETDPPYINFSLTIAPFSSVGKRAIISPILATLFTMFFSPASSPFLCHLLPQSSSKNVSILTLISLLLFSLKPIPIRLYQNCLHQGHDLCVAALYSIFSVLILMNLAAVFHVVRYPMSLMQFLPLDSRTTQFLGFPLSSLMPPAQVHC